MRSYNEINEFHWKIQEIRNESMVEAWISKNHRNPQAFTLKRGCNKEQDQENGANKNQVQRDLRTG